MMSLHAAHLDESSVSLLLLLCLRSCLLSALSCSREYQQASRSSLVKSLKQMVGMVVGIGAKRTLLVDGFSLMVFGMHGDDDFLIGITIGTSLVL